MREAKSGDLPLALPVIPKEGGRLGKEAIHVFIYTSYSLFMP